MMTSYRELAEVCEELSRLSGRKDKVAAIVRFLRRLSPEEAGHAALFLIGRTLPEGLEERLEISWATLDEVLENRGQQTLEAGSPPTILEVAEAFRRMAGIRGKGSRERKKLILSSLISRMTALEKKWFTRMVIGEMQHGVNEGVLLEALSELAERPLEKVQRADMLLGDVSELAMRVRARGGEAVDEVRLQVFRPIKPMLAESCESVEEALREMGGEAAFEYKYDGARVHIHVRGGEVRVFSRRLSEITGSVPDIVGQVREGVSAREAVLDGEAVAIGVDGRPLPFQELLKRFRRVHDVEEVSKKIPLKLRLFDILYLDGRDLLDEEYSRRWEIMAGVVDEDLLTPRIIASEPGEAEEFLRKALEEGHEGLMAKRLDSPYRPGRREKLWLKIKPAETLDLVIVAADWGHGRRTGWLSNYHLAAYNPETGGFEVVGKTFKGLTDEEFEVITKRLLSLKLSDDGYTVRVKPQIVVEVAFNEIQRSPKYRSGYALRFARIVRFRDDKRPEEADTIDRIRELYLRQFERKSLA